MISNDFTMMKFLGTIRKKLTANDIEAIYFFVNKKIINTG